jgi:hypothetical protein
MKRFVIAAMMIVLLPVAAYSQDKGPATARTEKEMKQDKEIDKAYRETMKRMDANGQAAKGDPWKTVRPAGNDGTNH